MKISQPSNKNILNNTPKSLLNGLRPSIHVTFFKIWQCMVLKCHEKSRRRDKNTCRLITVQSRPENKRPVDNELTTSLSIEVHRTPPAKNYEPLKMSFRKLMWMCSDHGRTLYFVRHRTLDWKNSNEKWYKWATTRNITRMLIFLRPGLFMHTKAFWTCQYWN